MHDLIGVVCAPNLKQDDLNKYVKYWGDLSNDAIPEFAVDRVKYIGNRPVIPWKEASQIMVQQLTVMKRLQHGEQ